LGNFRNIRKSRPIKGYPGLFEFKTNQGDRLVYFYILGARTIITQGFHKGTPADIEYKKAYSIRERCIKEFENA
jgi:hypothetical protein